jgi:hypothetical protein
MRNRFIAKHLPTKRNRTQKRSTYIHASSGIRIHGLCGLSVFAFDCASTVLRGEQILKGNFRSGQGRAHFVHSRTVSRSFVNSNSTCILRAAKTGAVDVTPSCEESISWREGLVIYKYWYKNWNQKKSYKQKYWQTAENSVIFKQIQREMEKVKEEMRNVIHLGVDNGIAWHTNTECEGTWTGT